MSDNKDPQTETKEPAAQNEVTPEPEPASELDIKPQTRAGGHKLGIALELEQ